MIPADGLSPGLHATVDCLEDLIDTLEEASADLRALAPRCRRLADEVGAGAPLGPTMEAEERPLIISRLTEVTERLNAAGSALRRAEAVQLREEGYTQEAIARLFAVTRQRAAALLKASSRR